jgi:hypothetical protein
VKGIDKLIKSAKPAVPNLPEGFGRSVIDRINSEGITIQSRGVSSLQRKTGFGFGVFAWVTAIILFSYTYYELRMNGSIELLYFGTRFLGSFLGNLPWDLISASMVLATLSAWMIKRSGFLKKGIALTIVVSYLVTGVTGAALATTGLNDQIEGGIEAKQADWPWLKVFRNERAAKFIHHPNFKMGKVESITNRNIIVVTPNGEQLQIQLPKNTRVQIGQVLRISGQEEQNLFQAQKVHVCNPSRVMRYFDHAQHHQQMMKPCCSSRENMMMH